MIRPGVLWTLGLTLALGCGRADRPTVKQTSMGAQDQSDASTASKSSQPTEDVHAGLNLPKRTRPKRDLSAQAKPADAVHAKPTEARDSKRPDGRPAEGPDAKTAGAAAPKSAKMTPSMLAKAAAVKPPKTGDTIPAKTAGRDDGAKVDSKEVRIGGMCLVAPKNWMREKPPISFILAQFSLPRAAGDKSDAQLTVTSPGEHNPKAIERVREQLKEKPEEGSVEHLQIAGNEVVLVDSTGDYNDGDEESDPSSKPASEGRYRALNAMVFLGNKVYMVNCTGPEKTVSERAGEFRAFLQTMKAADKP